MATLDNILLPTDFSEQSELAFEYAIQMTKCNCDITIHLLHIIEPIVYPTEWGFAQTAYVNMEKDLEKSAEEELDKLSEKLNQLGIKNTKVVLFGRASDGIIDYACENKIDMIIVSTHGAGGIERLLFGSTTERVMRKAHCPVLIVRNTSHK